VNKSGYVLSAGDIMIVLFDCVHIADVLLGDYLGLQVAIKVLKDKSMVQQFLSEAYVMTFVHIFFREYYIFIFIMDIVHVVHTV